VNAHAPEDAGPPGSGWLHNMSAMPTTVVTHQATDRFLVGRRLVFAWPPNVPRASPADLLAALDGVPPRGFLDDIEAILRRRLNEHARTLHLPPAAAVIDRAGPDDPVCRDLLSVLTVLAKSSPHVYLRDKEPNLAVLRPGRRVVLLLPPEKTP
jgi:hypothetical protein